MWLVMYCKILEWMEAAFVWCVVSPTSTSTATSEKNKSWSCSRIWSSLVSAWVMTQWLSLSHHASADLLIADEVKNLLNLSVSILCFQIPFRNTSSPITISWVLWDLLGLNLKMYPVFKYILFTKWKSIWSGLFGLGMAIMSCLRLECVAL